MKKTSEQKAAFWAAEAKKYLAACAVFSKDGKISFNGRMKSSWRPEWLRSKPKGGKWMVGDNQRLKSMADSPRNMRRLQRGRRV